MGIVFANFFMRSLCLGAVRNDEGALRRGIIRWAEQYGRYGYRRVTALLKNDGWNVNKKRVHRIWRREGLKVPFRRPKRGRLWLADGSCIRHRPKFKNHVWSYDFVFSRTKSGRAIRMLTVMDEFSRECLAIEVDRKLNSKDVLEVLADLFLMKGAPCFVRSDNGPEFIAKELRKWLSYLGVKTLYIEPGSPWENGYIESFNDKLRDEFLDGEVFATLNEAKVLVENWRREYNHIRSHSALGYRPPAPRTLLPGYELEGRRLEIVN